jgi:hypothetical protein
MRLNRRLLLLPGIAAIIASIALAGISFSTLGEPALAQIADPTTDPCQQAMSIGAGGEVAALAQQQPCESPTEEKRPKSQTPTVKPTEVPKTDVPSTSTPVPPPPPPPSGGTQGGGVRPPDTGTGGAGSAGSPWLFVAGGLALAVFGVGSTAFGLRRR